MKTLRSNLTYANVVASLCLFLLIGGGTAFAATHLAAKNSVGTKQLKKGAVTAVKLSQSAKQALIGAPGAPGPSGMAGTPGAAGSAGTPETSEPLAIDASAPQQPLPLADSFLPLDGRTSWTAPSKPAGLLVASLEVTAATNTGAQEEECEPTVEVFDNGERVTNLWAGVSGVYGGNTTLTKYTTTSPLIPIDMLNSSASQTITAKYKAGATIDCAPGTQIEGLRIIVQPLG